MNPKMVRIFFCSLLLFLLFTPVALAQDVEVEPTQIEYVVLFLNSIIAGLGVQLFKWKLIPKIKQAAPYLLPVIALGVGTLSAWLLSTFGVDIGPLEAVIELGLMSGVIASAGFSTIKEGHNSFKGTQ